MKHKKFDREILKEIKTLYVYDNWHAPIALLMDYTLIIFAIILAEYSYWFLPLTLLIIGSRQRALATILHEASHSALTRNKKFGKIIGTYFSGYLIFQSWNWNSYTQSHVKNHHPKIGTDLDPDYDYYKSLGVFNAHSKKEVFWKFFFAPILCLKLFSNVKYLIVNRLMSNANKKELLKILFVHLVFFVLGTKLVGYKFYFLYWLLPYFTVFQMITWFIELAEHYPMIAYAKSNIEISRNRFSHFMEHFFTGMHGENYHFIHHLFPAIPFWNLKKAHFILMQDDEYRSINMQFGGIFISSNKNPSMWQQL